MIHTRLSDAARWSGAELFGQDTDFFRNRYRFAPGKSRLLVYRPERCASRRTSLDRNRDPTTSALHGDGKSSRGTFAS